MLIDPTKSLKLPAERCALCGKCVEDVGGRRLIATGRIVVTHSDESVQNDDRRSFALGDGEGYVLLKGDWSPDAIDRAVSAFREGRRPWFCQACGGRQCPECGSPMAADTLHDDGTLGHFPIIPCDPRCTNRKCAKFLPT